MSSQPDLENFDFREFEKRTKLPARAAKSQLEQMKAEFFTTLCNEKKGQAGEYFSLTKEEDVYIWKKDPQDKMTFTIYRELMIIQEYKQ